MSHDCAVLDRPGDDRDRTAEWYHHLGLRLRIKEGELDFDAMNGGLDAGGR